MATRSHHGMGVMGQGLDQGANALRIGGPGADHRASLREGYERRVEHGTPHIAQDEPGRPVRPGERRLLNRPEQYRHRLATVYTAGE